MTVTFQPLIFATDSVSPSSHHHVGESLFRSAKGSKVLAALRRGEAVSLENVWGSAAVLAATEIVRKVEKPILFVAATPEDALRAVDDFTLFSALFTDSGGAKIHELVLFPASETWRNSSSPTGAPFSDIADDEENDGEYDSEADTGADGTDSTESYQTGLSIDDSAVEFPSVGDDLFGQRTAVLKQLLRHFPKNNVPPTKGSPPIFVTSMAALLQPVPPPEMMTAKTRTIAVGEVADQTEWVKWLRQCGFSQSPGVDLPGEFAQRGAILDIFAPDWSQPVRVEFFGDEVESIREFDIATQRSLKNLNRLEVTLLQADIPYTANFTDYVPQDTIVFLPEIEHLRKSAETYLARTTNIGDSTPNNVNKQTFLAPSAPSTAAKYNPALTLGAMDTVFAAICRFPTVTASQLAQGTEKYLLRLPLESVEKIHGDLPTVKEEIAKNSEDTFTIVCPTEAETRRLAETFADIDPMKNGRIHFAVGSLASGFRITTANMIFIGSGEMFQRHDVRRHRRRHLGQVIDSFLELKPGDLIVHVSHGIGRFRGLMMMTKSQQEEEHLQLEFAEGAMLYVPVSKIQLVQKYVAGSRGKPKLAKLGGATWNRQKKAVQEAVFDLAVEMIELQAARETKPGISFPADSDWQHEFDATFPYRETDDQLTAIEAIKEDMQRVRPMDRLICGDVGFGKTEVAMRAVFKAVDAGYQVAVLVPTTILAEQHFRTFSERMKEFPFKVAAMSRFQSKKEQRQILADLAVGRVDVVIGTHRIVSKDVAFHNLGLVTIDEEQRFGVDHKERLKTLKQTVDVLTLTATPIPRTLHFSLLGIRDISNLETPPEDRLAVETRLVRFQQDLIRSAMMRELARGGQIYFVHNRVSDIEQLANRLQRIVPEARIGIGHAQMPEGELEIVMREFVHHQFDVLVCTTIIESGLDIPNANTIFIDGADRFGLADLHQLRGRVGRYRNQAYCYLMVPPSKPLTNDAAKRLRAIEEFSHLGAGFHLAMRDLEIRGAGNILGTQQSGHIAVVGYEMYCHFLESAVRTLKQMSPKTVVEVELDLPGSAKIPKTYIDNQRMKIDLYRRMTRVTTLQELADLRSEIQDRFGKPPAEVQRLLLQSEVRVLAHQHRIRKVRLEKSLIGDPAFGTDGGQYIVFEYVSQLHLDELRKNLQRRNVPLRTTDDFCAYLPIQGSVTNPDAVLRFLRQALG